MEITTEPAEIARMLITWLVLLGMFGGIVYVTLHFLIKYW